MKEKRLTLDSGPIDWHELDISNINTPEGSVISVWMPLLTDKGELELLNPNVKQELFVLVKGNNAAKLLTVTASVTQMANEEPFNKWLPKVGAARFQTLGTMLYAPHGGVLIIGFTDYYRPLPVGIMLHLGF